uniref:Uncharacterized protein n=1 Tax=Panagrolaimus superbus TaxID=310955 RepID=A0A914YE85_9BILA
MHFENYNYWLELEDKIVEFERKRQTRATQNIISDIKRAKDDIKKSLKQFGKSNKPVALFDQERINQLIQRFQSELTSPNQTYYG